jgi:glycogen synthase
MAKAGGLGDVVGALPKYQNELGHFAKVLMPMYRQNINKSIAERTKMIGVFYVPVK